ncbi:MAG: hypothetical protein ABSH03_09160, partial [Candidatus Lustribacter sp.]
AVLQITDSIGLARSKAVISPPGAVVQAKDIVKLTKWVPAERPTLSFYAEAFGARTDAASVWADLPACLPRASAWVLDGIAGPDELWRAEARVWARIEREAVRLNATVRPGPEMIVGLVALLATDARRTRAALELAARGGGVIAPWFDAVA